MGDESPRSGSGFSSARALAERRGRAGALEIVRAIHAAVAIVGFLLVGFVFLFEGGTWQARAFSFAVYGLILSALLLLTRKLLFSAVAAAVVPLLVFGASRMKLHFLESPLLYFDVVYLTRSNFIDLMYNDPRIGLAVVAAASVVLVLLAASWLADVRGRSGVRTAAAASIASVTILFVSAPELKGLDELDLRSWNHKVASFFVSAVRSSARLEPRADPVEALGQSVPATAERSSNGPCRTSSSCWKSRRSTFGSY